MRAMYIVTKSKIGSRTSMMKGRNKYVETIEWKSICFSSAFEWIAQFLVSNRIFFARFCRILACDVSGTINSPRVPKKEAIIRVIQAVHRQPRYDWVIKPLVKVRHMNVLYRLKNLPHYGPGDWSDKSCSCKHADRNASVDRPKEVCESTSDNSKGS